MEDTIYMRQPNKPHISFKDNTILFIIIDNKKQVKHFF